MSSSNGLSAQSMALASMNGVMPYWSMKSANGCICCGVLRPENMTGTRRRMLASPLLVANGWLLAMTSVACERTLTLLRPTLRAWMVSPVAMRLMMPMSLSVSMSPSSSYTQ